MTDELKEKSTVVPIDVVELQLGEKIYQVSAAGLVRSEKWRARLQVEFNAMLALLREQGGIFENIDPARLKETISNLNLIEFLPVIGTAFAQLNVSMSAMGELIILYSPDLEKDQDYILEHTTRRQAVAAVMEMVKLEYPFGMILGQNPTGLPATTTLPNWPSQLGELAQPN